MKENILVKRKMETKGAGEVRRVHIVYFLSRKGRIEHPHLIRVHPLNLNGVRLRDVKRWLSDLRGKEMPDSYAWSYKRRYKAGYVWQDLLDDDLITPISDNEYVLKGSEISGIFSACSCCENNNENVEKKPAPEASKESFETAEMAKSHSQNAEEIKLDDNLWKTLPEIDGEFRTSGEVSCSDSSTQTDDSSFRRTSSSFRKPESTVEPSIRDEKHVAVMEEARAVQDHSATKKNENSNGESNRASKSSRVLRNLLHCGTVETNDAVVTVINRNKASNNKNFDHNKREVISGSRIAGGNSSRSFAKRRSGFACRTSNSYKGGNQKTVAAVFKPVSEPNCSQCGKGFKPEKMHAHMKSCRGLKARMRTVEAHKVAQRATTDELPKEEEAGLVLHH